MSKYNPQEIESKWLKIWEKKPLYRPVDPSGGGVAAGKKKKFYALVEFPYPSGEGLHMGHAFTNTILDVLVRKKRMEGLNVLYPMGWDAFGLPTENYAIKTGIHPAMLTKKNTNRFRNQMKRLGLAYNWDREVNTTDPSYYRWTQWIFLQLFKHGLAYKAEMPVGWCPSCKIILANEEIVSGKCERCGAEAERRMQKQWLLRITAYADRLADELDLVDYPDYVKASQRNWIGRSEGTIIKFKVPTRGRQAGLKFKVKEIEVFTTRPDTLFGVTAMVLAPEHPLTSVILQASQGGTSEVTRRGSSDGEGIGERRCLEMKAYVDQAKKKSELERTELVREKTGVFTGFYCFNPINKEKIPIWIGDYVVATYGGGAVMVVPAHDQRDFEFAKKYKLPIKVVVVPLEKGHLRGGGDPDGCRGRHLGGEDKDASDGVRMYEGCFSDYGVLLNSGSYTGLTSQEAIKKITEDLVQRDWGRRTVQYHLRDWIFSRQHYWGEPMPMVYCPSCADSEITWWNTEEGRKFLNSKSEALNPKQDQNSNDQNPKQGIGFEHLDLENSDLFRISDFGFRISKDLAGWFPVSEEELPIELPEVEKYQPTGTGESPLAVISDWVNTVCPHCGGAARRETDTMPNWAGSSWYYLAYVFGHHLRQSTSEVKSADTSEVKREKSNVFKKHQDLLNYWMPVDLYLGGAEHTTLHLLYSRFWHKFLNDIGIVPGKEPYAARKQHGVILGEDGFKMSKSRGNVINPEEVIKKYGSDTLRVYLLFMGPYEATMPWSTKGVEGAYRFLKRVWRLANNWLHLQGGGDPTRQTGQGRHLGAGDDSESLFWIHKTIKKVTEDIENFHFNTALSALMELVNFLSKKPIEEISLESIETLVKLLAPFAPFMAEELWESLRPSQINADLNADQRRSVKAPRDTSDGVRMHSDSAELTAEASEVEELARRSVHQQPWPQYNPKFIKEEKTTIVIQINGKVRDKIEIDWVGTRFTSVAQKERIKKLVLSSEKIKRHLKGRELKKTIFVPGRLINLVV